MNAINNYEYRLKEANVTRRHLKHLNKSQYGMSPDPSPRLQWDGSGYAKLDEYIFDRSIWKCNGHF